LCLKHCREARQLIEADHDLARWSGRRLHGRVVRRLLHRACRRRTTITAEQCCADQQELKKRLTQQSPQPHPQPNPIALQYSNWGATNPAIAGRSLMKIKSRYLSATKEPEAVHSTHER
jgi:hypothetical protein